MIEETNKIIKQKTGKIPKIKDLINIIDIAKFNKIQRTFIYSESYFETCADF